MSTKTDIQQAFKALNDEEKLILTLRFGLDGQGNRRREDVVPLLGTTRVRIGQKTLRAIRSLKSVAKKWPLPVEDTPDKARSIFDLNLGPNFTRPLIREGYITVGMLSRATPEELSSIIFCDRKFFGKGRIQQIRAALQTMGLDLASPVGTIGNQGTNYETQKAGIRP